MSNYKLKLIVCDIPTVNSVHGGIIYDKDDKAITILSSNTVLREHGIIKLKRLLCGFPVKGIMVDQAALKLKDKDIKSCVRKLRESMEWSFQMSNSIAG